MPPAGLWTTTGYNDDNADPAPTLTVCDVCDVSNVSDEALAEFPSTEVSTQAEMTEMSSHQPDCTDVPTTCLASSLDKDVASPSFAQLAQNMQFTADHKVEETAEGNDDDMVLVNFEDALVAVDVPP
jgi:hypothetical protein